MALYVEKLLAIRLAKFLVLLIIMSPLRHYYGCEITMSIASLAVI